MVPSPLLAFSLAVLRATFSNPALRKPVHTFAFERRSEASEALLAKTRAAIATHAIVVSTPAAIKVRPRSMRAFHSCVPCMLSITHSKPAALHV